jgi:hypothetical protein
MPSKFNDKSSKTKSENPLPDEKVCFNCKYMMWLVGLGLGLKCELTKHNIENRRHTCEKFEFKQS